MGAGVLAAGMAWSSPAEAADDERGRPWAKGTVVPSFGFGFGYSQDLISLSFGLGASYYIANGFSVGLNLDDQILLYSGSLKGDLPDLENQIPTNVFRLTPVAQWVFLRRPRFSPYVFGGVGPVFFNNDSGVFGHWTAGPGAYIGVGGPLWLDLGVGFSGLFPTDQCNASFEYQPGGDFVDQTPIPVLDYCSFRWGPRLGLVLAFGGGGRSRENREPAPDPFMEPPANPMPEPEPEPEPESEPPLPEPATADDTAVTPPAAAPRETSLPPAPAESVAPPPAEDVAPPPAEPPPPALGL